MRARVAGAWTRATDASGRASNTNHGARGAIGLPSIVRVDRAAAPTWPEPTDSSHLSRRSSQAAKHSRRQEVDLPRPAHTPVPADQCARRHAYLRTPRSKARPATLSGHRVVQPA